MKIISHLLSMLEIVSPAILLPKVTHYTCSHSRFLSLSISSPKCVLFTHKHFRWLGMAHSSLSIHDTLDHRIKYKDILKGIKWILHILILSRQFFVIWPKTSYFCVSVESKINIKWFLCISVCKWSLQLNSDKQEFHRLDATKLGIG